MDYEIIHRIDILPWLLILDIQDQDDYYNNHLEKLLDFIIVIWCRYT